MIEKTEAFMELKSVTIERVVEKQHMASVMKSGSLDVLATPQMIAWMEEAACLCLDLDPSQTSVGISMQTSHDAPSALGAKISITATMTEVKGRKISYDVEAKDGETTIGQGKHARFIVDAEKFLSKVYPK